MKMPSAFDSLRAAFKLVPRSSSVTGVWLYRPFQVASFACDKCDAQLFGCRGEHRGEYCGACGELTFYNKAKSREELYDAGVPLYCSIDCPDNHPHPHACGDRCWNPFCFMTLRPDVDPSCPAPPPHNQPRSCSQCGVVSYCSSECEEEDRAQHAPECACYALKRTAVGTDQR